MKRLLFTISLMTALMLSPLTQAREVTFTTQLARYNGSGAYLAIYLTDAKGKYKQTIWVAGKKKKYYKELRGWARGSGKKKSEYDGKTGASITSGHTFTVTQNIDDKLIDHGYQVVIDTAVEDEKKTKADVILPLTTIGSGKAVAGSTYILSFTYNLN